MTHPNFPVPPLIDHAYHAHCINKFIKTRNVCALGAITILDRAGCVVTCPSNQFPVLQMVLNGLSSVPDGRMQDAGDARCTLSGHFSDFSQRGPRVTPLCPK